jgi:poly(3-hydroxybutyrate) depolymerase
MKTRTSSNSSLLLFLSAAFVSTPYSGGPRPTQSENYNGRDLLVYLPRSLPAPGRRALVIVLHGGLGNASRIEAGT